MKLFPRPPYAVLMMFFSLSVTYCQTTTTLSDKVLLKENLTIIASDEFEGREIASKGAAMAAEYLADHLKEYGVKPFGDNGSYYQEFPIYVTGYEFFTKLEFDIKNDSDLVFVPGSDYLIYSPAYVPLEFSKAESELVYAGYGITADEYDYDDYENLDIEGKVVVVMGGEPESNDNDFFEADYRTEYSETRNKLLTAEENGAIAMITLPDEEAMSTYRFKARRIARKNFSFEDDGELSDREDETIPSILLSVQGARKLFRTIDKNFYRIRSHMNKYPPNSIIFDAEININYWIKFFNEKRTARNVVGIVEGNNPDLATEYISMGAHYDHEGIKNGVVYNGADDNGSGTVSILEAARLLAKNKTNQRPILVIFHTGEERGLLGSKYLTENAEYVENVISHINVDMVGREEENEIYSIGSDVLSLEYHQLIESVNSETVNMKFDYKYDGPNDVNRYYYRSDHYNYAKQDIPVVFFYDHMTKDYHRPSDDVEKINLNKISRITDLIYHICLRVANLDHTLEVD